VINFIKNYLKLGFLHKSDCIKYYYIFSGVPKKIIKKYRKSIIHRFLRSLYRCHNFTIIIYIVYVTNVFLYKRWPASEFSIYSLHRGSRIQFYSRTLSKNILYIIMWTHLLEYHVMSYTNEGGHLRTLRCWGRGETRKRCAYK